MGGLQEFLKRQGKAVFGSGKSGKLESGRLDFIKLVEMAGLPVVKYDVAVGVDELDEKLKKVEDKWVKSELRGDCETFHHTNYELSKMELKRMRHDMGVYDKMETYLITNPIEAIGEIGYDGYVVDGNYPEISCSGIEVKDSGYIGKMIRFNDLPKQLKDVNERFGTFFKSFNYRGAFSTEVRVDKEKRGYFIDPTMRFPQPNTSLTLEMYDNYSEIIWDVANGVLPEIKYSYKWGVQFIIKSEIAKTEPCAIQFPDKYKNFVKIKNLVVDNDGVYYYTPNNIEMCEIGSVVGLGRTMDQAIKMASEIAKEVKGFDLKINTECLGDAKDQIEKLSKYGINFL